MDQMFTGEKSITTAVLRAKRIVEVLRIRKASIAYVYTSRFYVICKIHMMRRLLIQLLFVNSWFVDSRLYDIHIGSPTINSSAVPEVWGLGFHGPLMDLGLSYLKERFEGIANISHKYLFDNNRRSEVSLGDDVENFVARYYHENIHSADMVAFIGASSRSVEQQTQMTRALRTFQLSGLGNGPNQLHDPQFVSTSVYPLTALIGFCEQLFEKNKWTSIASIIDLPSFLTFPMVRAMDGVFNHKFKSGPNVFYTRFEYNAVLDGREKLNQIFKLISEISRVVFIFATGPRFRQIMIAAAQQNLTNGDYVFVLSLMQMKGLPDVLQPPYSWRRNDVDDLVAFHAYKSVLVISHVIEFPEDPVPGFRKTVLRIAREKYNFSYPANMIPSNLYPSYEMFLLYGEILNETLRSNGSLEDGFAFARRFVNRTFSLPTGELHIDKYGERMVDIAGDIMDPSGNFTRVYQYSHQIQQMSVLMEVGIVWPSGIWPVPNKPKCGYKNDLCFSQSHAFTIIAVVVAASCVIFILLISWIIWGLQRWKSVESRWWQIALTDLVDLPEAGPNKAQTFASSSIMNLSFARTGRYNARVSKLVSGETVWATPVVNWKSGQKASVSWNLLQYLYDIKQINSDNVNKFVGICTEKPQATIYEAYCKRNSLADLIDQADDPDMDLKLSMLADLVSGLQYIHRSKIKFHGNLRTTKCLLDIRLALKISDLGSETIVRLISNTKPTTARYEFDDSSQAEVVKCLWTPPEVLRGHCRPDESSDIYAFAIIAHGLLCKVQPFGIRYEYAQSDASETVEKVREKLSPPFRPTFENQDRCTKLSTQAISLIQACWDENFHRRPSASVLMQQWSKVLKSQGILEHTFFGRVIARLDAYSEILEHHVHNSTKLLLIERDRCEKLLGEMFPREILRRLQDGKAVVPEHFDSVTVYFGSIFGFLGFVKTSTPAETSTFLDAIYTRFDREIVRFGVYKVETIGDIYMVASGLPTRNGTRHITEICNMALQLQKSFHNDFTARVRLPLELRMGIHTGSLAAGVVGTKCPRYCLFGDAVNTASRMESHGEPSKIHLSESAAKLAGNSGFVLELRGELEVKGKGRINTYWLTGCEEPNRIST